MVGNKAWRSAVGDFLWWSLAGLLLRYAVFLAGKDEAVHQAIMRWATGG